MPCDRAIWDVTALRRLLVWARENDKPVNLGVPPEYRVVTPSVNELESLYRLEDER